MDTEKMSSLLKDGTHHLHRHNLLQAESCFHLILDNYQEFTSMSDETTIHIGGTIVGKQQSNVTKSVQTERLSEEVLDILTQSLVSLSEINTKKSRRYRHNACEWFHFNLCAIAYIKEAIYLCEKNEDLDEPGWKDMDVVAKKMRIENKLRLTQESFNKHIKEHIVDETNKCVHEKSLEELVQFLRDSVLLKKTQLVDDSEPKAEAAIIPCPLSRENSLRKKPEPKSRTMDLNKIQKAITKLVKNITRDIRSRYRRKKLSEETMRRSVSCQIISLMSPLSDDDDLLNLFEQVIAEDDEEDATSLELDIETKQNSSKNSQSSSVNSSPRHGPKTELKVQLTPVGSKEGPSTSGSNGNNTGISGITMQMKTPVSPPLSTSTTSSGSDCKSESPSLHIVEGSVLNTPPSNLPGVLTLWKGYRTARPNSLPFKQHRIMGCEEISPITDPKSSLFTENGMQPSPLQQITVHPITVAKLYETLAHMLVIIAENYKEESSYDLSIELYKYALGLAYQCPKSNRNGVLVAVILKTLGIIKSCKGDLVAGCQLLDESMQVFKSLHVKDKVHHVSEIWLELGKAYLMEQDHVTSLFGHIMSEVRGELDSEFKPETFEIPIPEESDDSDSSQGESYSLHVFEAIECLDSALTELQKLDLNDEGNKCLYITILTKLADCQMVTGNYDKAVNNYEEAMGHCKNVGGSATIENNAHMLSMLGICNFLLGNYPKAASMLETASILQQHIYGQCSSFGLVFTLTMLGLTYYKMRQYHKCIVWCIKSNDLNKMLYDVPVEDVISTIHFNRAWFIIQTLFTLGYAYYTLNFNDKAIIHLENAQDFIERCQETDIKQHVKLLKVIADTYVNLDNHENALTIYEKALSIAASIGDEKSSIALQNQLLNCMAGVEVHVRHYTGAAEYLEQALGHQKNVQSSIKDDLVDLQYQLGKTYVMSGDIDKAIDCFDECLETVQEVPGTPGKEMVNTFGKLASLFYVKGLMQEDNEYMNELLTMANSHFSNATCLDSTSAWNVHYANFLMQQDQPADALEQMLPILFTKYFKGDKEIVFSGLEQAILPEQLHNESEDLDDFVIDTRVFANFLAVLCFKDIGLRKDADDCLVNMYKLVLSSKKYNNYALMGYAFLEMKLPLEAAECFDISSQLSHYNMDIAVTNSCLCYCLHMYQMISKQLQHIIQVFFAPTCLPVRVKDNVNVTWASENKRTLNIPPVVQDHGNRDSGYFDNIADFEPEQAMSQDTSLDSSKSKSKSDVSFTSSSLQYESDSSFITDQSMLSDDNTGYTSGESSTRDRRDSLRKSDTSSLAYEEEVWETIDESGNVIDTKIVKSQIVSSIIYEVENNGNYQAEDDYDKTINDLRSIAGTKNVCNANFRASLSETINSQMNESWSTTKSVTSTTEKTSSNQSSPKRKLPDSNYTYPNKYNYNQNKSVYRSSFIEPSVGQYKSGTESDTEEEVWETIEETVETPPEVLRAIMANQRKL